MAKPFNDADRAAVYRAIYERRDMRHFVRGPVDPAVLQRLLDAAHHAPSVGYMQPWRIARITDPALRDALHDAVERERLQTADALGKRRDEFMKLKVEGMRDCAEVLVVALMDGRETHIFGRRTLPEMDLASVACAIQNMWLAARAEGIGIGWVSLFDPNEVRALLHMPDGAQPVAILCVGQIDDYYPEPMLEMEHWATRARLGDCVFENRWPDGRTLKATAASTDSAALHDKKPHQQPSAKTRPPE
ncbi:5,6-dimethylbenzimidazole synthase [Paraburkholderia rhizosphaerae]|uniref:Cob(II)yrinic acid a,c-diamide reductase n=1 Tax=Paraburkholderia rhizosphaerae TaxID=480658 RepID=A0A4R8LUI5_9BURK|nr:5,6-dimethylbenzimidazole synthase [Paraburkholderia rhizosphaerae]TDY50822.1 cob(II)yrinic acid a,c-diamide reductase [Paraburkholderia rhizosphaerae]